MCNGLLNEVVEVSEGSSSVSRRKETRDVCHAREAARAKEEEGNLYRHIVVVESAEEGEVFVGGSHSMSNTTLRVTRDATTKKVNRLVTDMNAEALHDANKCHEVFVFVVVTHPYCLALVDVDLRSITATLTSACLHEAVEGGDDMEGRTHEGEVISIGIGRDR